ncbi:MAG: phosphoglycerate kinase [Pseudomonadota bacterium]
MTTKAKTLDQLAVDGKRVLVRVDINVPMQDGKVTDDTRIRAIVPTVHDILAGGGQPLLVAHFGRPKGKVVSDLSLGQLQPDLERAIGSPVVFAQQTGDQSIVEAAAARLSELTRGSVMLLENVRFEPGEEANDDAFADALAGLADIYVNDAFSAAHRAHASTDGVARRLPSAAGRQMEAELKALEAALGMPHRPVAAVVGGAKVSTKIDVLNNLVEKVDKLIVGGGMANTFLLAKGVEIGKSLAEPDLVPTAAEILEKAAAGRCEILLPIDVTTARAFAEGAASRVCDLGDVGSDEMILDVGPATVAALADHLNACKTLVWNGPLGAFEIAPFGEGTFALAREAARLTEAGQLVAIAGGGDTVAALNAAEAASAMTYISTAGGAFLEWLEGKTLPGVAALTQ